MVDEDIGTAQEDIVAVLVVARVHIVTANGKERTVYATEVSRSGLSCISVSPPGIGTRITATVHLLGSESLPPVEAWVIGVRVDPESAERSGFEAVFVNPGDAWTTLLAQALPAAARNKSLLVRRRPFPVPQRRASPRVPTRMPANVQLGGWLSMAVVLNLSMGGALVTLDPSSGVELPDLGAPVELSLPGLPGGPGQLRLSGRIAWRVAQQGRIQIGVQFDPLDEDTTAHLDELIQIVLIDGPAEAR